MIGIGANGQIASSSPRTGGGSGSTICLLENNFGNVISPKKPTANIKNITPNDMVLPYTVSEQLDSQPNRLLLTAAYQPLWADSLYRGTKKSALMVTKYERMDKH